MQVEKFIKEKLGGFMYNHGRGEFITKTELLRWKFRDNAKVSTYKLTRTLLEILNLLFLWLTLLQQK